MRVFIYEFVTGGGWWSIAERAPTGSLLAEGAGDACRGVRRLRTGLPGVQVSNARRFAAGRAGDFADESAVVESACGERESLNYTQPPATGRC